MVDSRFLYSVLSMVMPGYILAVKGRRQYIASSLVLVLISLAWVLGMNKRYTGPVWNIEFDEGIGIKQIDEPPAEPPAAQPPATPA